MINNLLNHFDIIYNVSMNQSKFTIINLISAGISATISKLISAPVQVPKIIISTDPNLKTDFRTNLKYQIQRIYFSNFFRNNIFRNSYSQALNFSFKQFFKTKFNQYFNQSSSVQINFISGAIAGIFSLTILYPIGYSNKIQYLIQIQTNPQLNSFKNRIRKLYKGFAISCLGIALFRSIYFGLYDSLQQKLSIKLQNNFFVCLFLGYTSTIFADCISLPIHKIRRQTLLNRDSSKFMGSIDCARYILLHEGMGSFFYRRGLLKSGISGGFTLALFDKIKKLLIMEKNSEEN